VYRDLDTDQRTALAPPSFLNQGIRDGVAELVWMPW
jgi:hypothetical protein